MYHSRKLRRRNPYGNYRPFRRNLVDPSQLVALRNPSPMESNEKHHQSELLAVEAENLLRQDKKAAAQATYADASTLEEQATDALPPNLPRTLSIYAVSTVALAFKANDFNRTRMLIAKYRPRVQDWAQLQLDEIATEIHRSNGKQRNPYRRNLIDPAQLAALRKNPYRRNLWTAKTIGTRAARLAEMKDALAFADPTKVDAEAWANIYDLVPRDILDAAESLGIEVGARGVKDPCWPKTCPPYTGSERRRNPYISMYSRNPSIYQSGGFRRNPDPEGNAWGPKLYNPLEDSKHEFKDESHYQRMIAKLRRRNPFKGY